MSSCEMEHSVEDEEEIDPIEDIIDYLVRCSRISFKNAHIDETEIKTCDKIRLAHALYKKSPTSFLKQFGRFLSPNHVGYFEGLDLIKEDSNFSDCVNQLKKYHSNESTRKRKRNRRYKAMQKLLKESDYFSDKQMMYRNPLLYEQLVGQYLTNEEVRERDSVDNDNLTLLNMILETVDRNEMREKRNEQELEESHPTSVTKDCKVIEQNREEPKQKPWGSFDVPDTKPSHIPDVPKQTMITAPEKRLLREEFEQEMISSFLEGLDLEVDYSAIDNDEEFDDLVQVSQDAEDKYFDSEANDEANLEVHMKLVQEYGRKNPNNDSIDDPLDVFMERVNKRLNAA